MTLSALFGSRTPPKSMCTHRHSRQKFLPKKSRFLRPGGFRASASPIWVLRSKIVLNVFFGPLSISYDAWMMSHNKLKKLFLRLKIGPKVTFLPKSLLTFYCCKIDLFKGKPPENRHFGTLFQECITFFWRRVGSQYWYGIKVWYGTLFGPHPTPSMCTHQVQTTIFFICG